MAWQGTAAEACRHYHGLTPLLWQGKELYATDVLWSQYPAAPTCCPAAATCDLLAIQWCVPHMACCCS